MKIFMLLLLFLLAGCDSSCTRADFLGGWRTGDKKMSLQLNEDDTYEMLYENTEGQIVRASGHWEFNGDLEAIELHSFPVAERPYYKKAFGKPAGDWKVGFAMFGVSRKLISKSCIIDVDVDTGIYLEKVIPTSIKIARLSGTAQ